MAEAAKIIENTQRDVNIAFINEVTKVLNSLNINTDRVLEAASTKWNFLKFHPGLVGDTASVSILIILSVRLNATESIRI